MATNGCDFPRRLRDRIRSGLRGLATWEVERGGLYARFVPDLVLVRHGQSTWNEQNLFTGWVDVALSDRGRREATEAGVHLREATDLDLRVVHTSVLKRAIQTANLLLEEAGLLAAGSPALAPQRAPLRGPPGSRQEGDREKYGADQVRRWRRSYSEPPPPLESDDPGTPATTALSRHPDGGTCRSPSA